MVGFEPQRPARTQIFPIVGVWGNGLGLMWEWRAKTAVPHAAAASGKELLSSGQAIFATVGTSLGEVRSTRGMSDQAYGVCKWRTL